MQEVASKRLANGFLVCLTNRERFVCMAVGRAVADNRKWNERPASEIVCVGDRRIQVLQPPESFSFFDRTRTRNFPLPAKAAFVRGTSLR